MRRDVLLGLVLLAASCGERAPGPTLTPAPAGASPTGTDAATPPSSLEDYCDHEQVTVEEAVIRGGGGGGGDSPAMTIGEVIDQHPLIVLVTVVDPGSPRWNTPSGCSWFEASERPEFRESLPLVYTSVRVRIDRVLSVIDTADAPRVAGGDQIDVVFDGAPRGSIIHPTLGLEGTPGPDDHWVVWPERELVLMLRWDQLFYAMHDGPVVWRAEEGQAMWDVEDSGLLVSTWFRDHDALREAARLGQLAIEPVRGHLVGITFEEFTRMVELERRSPDEATFADWGPLEFGG